MSRYSQHSSQKQNAHFDTLLPHLCLWLAMKKQPVAPRKLNNSSTILFVTHAPLFDSSHQLVHLLNNSRQWPNNITAHRVIHTCFRYVIQLIPARFVSYTSTHPSVKKTLSCKFHAMHTNSPQRQAHTYLHVMWNALQRNHASSNWFLLILCNTDANSSLRHATDFWRYSTTKPTLRNISYSYIFRSHENHEIDVMTDAQYYQPNT